jgi:hypothetical protein
VFRAAPPEAFNAGNYKNKNLPPRKRGKYNEKKKKIFNTPRQEEAVATLLALGMLAAMPGVTAGSVFTKPLYNTTTLVRKSLRYTAVIKAVGLAPGVHS